MTPIIIHQYLHYSQHQQPNEPGVYCPIVWDLREAPAGAARHVGKLDVPLTTRRLGEPATYPPVTSLQITCNILPETHKVIEVTNSAYVTLLDVMQAIYDALHAPLEEGEWNRLTRKQQGKIQEAFDRRCRLALNPAVCAAGGRVLLDYVVNHVIFGGLSVSLENEYSAILSLRRPPP